MVLTHSEQVTLGSEAPDFSLPATDGRTITRREAKGRNGLLVMFICNHCPYVKIIKQELTRMAGGYQHKGIGVVAINSNDPVRYPDDDLPAMRKDVKDFHYTFPYCQDLTQEVARAYRASCTPEFFLYDKDLKLVYHGQFDSARPNNGVQPSGADLRAAIDALLEGKQIPAEDQVPSMGCNIKWRE